MKINSENNNSAVLSELGVRIKRNRIDMQLSQQDFAAKAGISTRTLSADLDLLLPELAFDPESYRTLGRERKRISKSNKNRSDILPHL